MVDGGEQAERKTDEGGKGGRGSLLTVDPLGLSALVTYVLIGGFLVFGFAWAIFPAVAQQNASPCRPLKPEPRSGAAPDWTVQDLQGNAVSLEDFRGKFVVLNFWATWCEPCITEWPQVHRLAERFADRDDVVVIAMSIDADPAPIGPFLERMALAHNTAEEGQTPQWKLSTPVQVLWDPEQKVQTAYGTKQIPDTYFVDEEGQLVHAFINVRPWGTPDAIHCIDSLDD